jgi:flagellar hook assembly protein FlgD
MKNSMRLRKIRAQASFELLVTLAFGLALLLPLLVFAFIQIANANASLSAAASQQAASKISSIATLVGSEGYPARQLVQVQVPPGVLNIYVGGSNSNGVGHQITFVIQATSGTSEITSYTTANISGNLDSVTSTGTYLLNMSYQQSCPSEPSIPCVYVTPVV